MGSGDTEHKASLRDPSGVSWKDSLLHENHSGITDTLSWKHERLSQIKKAGKESTNLVVMGSHRQFQATHRDRLWTVCIVRKIKTSKVKWWQSLWAVADMQGAAGNMQPVDLEIWKQRSGWFHQSGADVCTTPFPWRSVYCENQSSHSSCKCNHLLWGAERRGSTFRGLWSSSPLHQAEPQPETGLDRWVFPVGPWLDEGLLDTTGTGLRTPASLVLEETGLCFWRRPCGRRGIAEAWARSASVCAGPRYGRKVCPLSQALASFETRWEADSINWFLSSSGSWKHWGSSPLWEVTRQPSGQIYSLSLKKCLWRGRHVREAGKYAKPQTAFIAQVHGSATSARPSRHGGNTLIK